MKTYVITLSKVFLKGHRREGQPTDFAEKFRKQKVHTIRANYPLWKKRIEEVLRGDACLSIRQWSGKPYRSKQIVLAVLTKEDGVGIEQFRYEKDPCACMIGDFDTCCYDFFTPEKVAMKDGLDVRDWFDWFRESKGLMAVIHFTYFRYY